MWSTAKYEAHAREREEPVVHRYVMYEWYLQDNNTHKKQTNVRGILPVPFFSLATLGVLYLTRATVGVLYLTRATIGVLHLTRATIGVLYLTRATIGVLLWYLL